MNDNTTPLTAGEYNAKIGKIIPYYEEFHKQIIDIVKQKEQIESWLDVGCGTGMFERMILEDYPDVKITAIDPSEQMLMEAKRLVSEEKVTYVCQTSESIDFSEEFDVVTAVQVHHYLQEEERELATKNIYRALKKDGIYLTFENVVPEDKALTLLELQRWKRYQMHMGKTEEEADAHIRRCGVSYFPISMEAHMELLKRVGFRSVYVFWKSGMQMGIMGVK